MPTSESAAGLSIEFINTVAAGCSSLENEPIAEGYRYLVRFFRSALIDRTHTVQPGFRYTILDPIPTPRPDLPELESLCDARGQEIVEHARAQDQRIQLLWSGGIDSTVAVIAVVRAANALGYTDRIDVAHSGRSIREFPRFFYEFIWPKVQRKRIRLLKQALSAGPMIVTGEHGDQIFGSVLAADYLREARWYRREDRRLFDDWRTTLPQVMRKRLSEAQTSEAIAFLEPQLHHSPIALETLFDLLWWVNFSMKWQVVSLRMAAEVPDRFESLHRALWHFFKTDDFQRWSIAHHDEKIGTTWAEYKMPLKRYIHAHFPDQDYLQNKKKVPSLMRIQSTRVRRIYSIGYQIHFQEGAGDSCADSDSE